MRLLLSVEPGFDPSHVMTMQIVEAGQAFESDDARLQFVDGVLEAVRGVPGVEHAAFTTLLPLSGEIEGYGLDAQSRPGRNGEDGSALRYTVTPGYFGAMRIPLVAGRLLDDTDRPGGPRAVVINESLADRLFGGADPLGELVRFGPQIERDGPWAEVVGVVGDVKHYSLAVDAPDAFYTVNGQWEWVDNVQTLVVRAGGAEAALVPGLISAVWSVNAHVPIRQIQTMEGYVRASAGSRRFVLLAVGTLAIAALVLAVVGLYGVVAGSVTERVREIGIRTALGATSRDVAGDVVRQAETLTLTGAAIGMVGAYASSRLTASMLFGMSEFDPITYGSVTAVMAGVALLAAWAPARRALAVDPTIALRAE
jgi:putative ABC transport system permease protein